MVETSGKTKVLVVDDESIITMQISNMLESEGYDVVGTASDGGEAVKLAQELHPDIILMDIIMPKESGLDAIPKINESLPDTTIIVLTALQSRAILMEALDAGAKDYILKPYSRGELLNILKKYD